MASVNATHVQLARTLHPRLLKFFARFPPQTSGSGSGSDKVSTTPNTSSQDANAALTESSAPSARGLAPHGRNPFTPRKSSYSSHWVGPTYSLRQQADLYKLAQKQGVAELLPFTAKSLEERLHKREEFGLRVKGTGVGQAVKGHIKERFLKQKLDKRKVAMKRMPGLIRFWKLVSCALFTYCQI